jgi:type III secretion protein Q
LTHEPVRELGESTALPHIDPLARRALNRLYNHQATPLSLSLRGAAHAVHWVFDDAPMPPHDSYRFKLGARVGQLGLDVPAQIALFGERRLDLLPRELRYVLLADAAQEAVDRLMKATRLHFEWAPADAAAPPVPCDPQRAAYFSVPPASDAATRWRGFVQFDDAAALDSVAPPLDPRGAAAADTLARLHASLHFPLRFQIGTTAIRLREVGSIQAGDIVSIEDWRAAGSAVVVTAELGGPAGRRLVALAEGSRITVQQSRDSTMNRNSDTPPASADTQDAAGLPIDRLDALEVTLRFEVGDLQLSLGELKNIRAGHVFELGQPLNRSPVRILAHGNLLGKGYLVAVGDRLGVRVSEFAPSEM